MYFDVLNYDLRVATTLAILLQQIEYSYIEKLFFISFLLFCFIFLGK